METTLKVTVQATPAKTGWRVDRAAVTDALDMMGIRAAVTVKLSNGRKVHGSTGFDRYSGSYIVKVSRYVSRERATEVLWHELQHVNQSEERGGFDAFVAHYRRFSGVSGGTRRYDRNPFEVEANAIMRKYADCALVR